MAGTAGMGEKVRADGLDTPLNGAGEAGDGLEVLFGGPALRKGR